VSADGDRLRISAPEGAIDVGLRNALAARKPEILTFLRIAKSLSGSRPTVVPVQAGGRQRPLFVVPGHNGDVFCYVHLARHLGPDRPVLALEPPGLDGTRAPIPTVQGLAEHFASAISTFSPGPYLLGGFCVGGSLAFETARQLHAWGESVRLLALLGSPHPASFRPLNRALSGLLARLGGHARALSRLTPRGQARYLSRKWRERATRGGAPDAESPDAAHRRRLERTTISAVSGYQPGAFDGPVVLFLPSPDWSRSEDRPLDWAPLARGGFDTVIGPPDCNGDTMLREPHVRWLAHELRVRLDSLEDTR
jgi:thioesterase domain-containing protein